MRDVLVVAIAARWRPVTTADVAVVPVVIGRIWVTAEEQAFDLVITAWNRRARRGE